MTAVTVAILVFPSKLFVRPLVLLWYDWDRVFFSYIKMSTSFDWQVKEHAAHALGFLLVGDEHFPHHKKLIDGLCEASKVISDSPFLISLKIPALNKVFHKALFHSTLESLSNISGIIGNCPMSFQNLRKQFFVLAHLWILSEVVFGKYKNSLDDL